MTSDTNSSPIGTPFESSFLRRALVWVMALKIVGLILIFDTSLRALQGVDLPKSLWSRATAWLLLALLALAVARYGWRVIPRSRVHLLVAAYGCAVVLSALFAENRYIALFGDQSRFLGLTFTADMLVLYLAAAVAIRRVSDAIVVVAAGLGAGLVALAYAGIQLAGLDPIGWGEDPRVRPFATFGNPDILGHFISVLLGVTAGILLFAAGPHARRLRVGAAAYALVALGIGAALGTRGTAIGVAAVLVAAPLVVVRARGWSGLRTRQMRIIAGSAIVAAFLVLAFTPLGGRVRDTVTGSATTADRVLVYRTAIAAFLHRPLLGYGPDSFAVAFGPNAPAERARQLGTSIGDDSAHDWLLHALATTGAVGAIALSAVALAGLIVATGALLRLRPIAGAGIALGLIAYWCHGLVSVGAVAVDWWPWLGTGAAVGLSRTAAPTLPPLRRLPWIVTAVAIAAALVAGGMGTRALEANQDSLSARTSGARVSRIFAEDAVRLDPGRADYWNELGRARFSTGDRRGAAQAFTEAASRAPHVATYWANLARAQTQLAAEGDPAAAEAAVAAAIRAAAAEPTWPPAHISAAETALLFHRPELALREAVAAIELDPEPLPYRSLAIRAAAEVSDRALVATLLRQALAARDESALRALLARVELALGDQVAASEDAARAVKGGAPLEARIALARAFIDAGQERTVRDLSIIVPLRVVRVDRCDSRCVRITFSSDAGERSDPTQPDSATHLDNYTIDDRPLPTGSSLTLNSVDHVVVLRLAAQPIRPGAVIGVSHVKDAAGLSLDPDPTSVEIP